MLLILFFLLVCVGFMAGCTGFTRSEDTPVSGSSENFTAVAIGIALNNTTVRSHLSEQWTSIDVNMNATTTVATGGIEETFRTPDVIIYTRSRVLHVYVDVNNRSVSGIWDSPRRFPYP